MQKIRYTNPKTALGLIVGGPARAEAAHVLGMDSGVFVNPIPSGGQVVTAGVGTGDFVYGDNSGTGTPATRLTYTTANPIDATTDAPFTLGRLAYVNGTTIGDSTPDTDDLRITLDLTQPGIMTADFTLTLALVTTDNTGTPDQNADYVFFPSFVSSRTFTADGQAYTLRLTGLANVVGDGFLASSSDELHVREGGTATADLMGVVPTDIAAVPEPSSLALCGVASLAGLGTWARRRRPA